MKNWLERNNKSLVILGIFFFSFFFSHFASAATYYWVGTAAGNTSLNTNWNTSAASCSGTGNAPAAPVAADTIYFVSNCSNSATIDSALSVTNFYMNTGYAGTVIHNAVNLNVSGTFTKSAGTWTASAGATMGIGGNITTNGTNDFANEVITLNGITTTITSAGALGGKVVVTMTSNASVSSNITITAGTSISLGDDPTVSMAKCWNCGNGVSATLVNNGSMNIDSGLLTMTGTGSAIGTLTNNGTITHNGTGWTLSNFRLTNSANATTTFSSGTSLIFGGNFINNGTFIYDGTAISAYYDFTQTGTFDLSGKTVTFIGSYDSTVTAGNSLASSTVVINKTAAVCYVMSMTVASGTTINLGNSPATTLSTGGYCGQGNRLINNGTIITGTGTWSITGASVGESFVNNGTIIHGGSGWSFGSSVSFTNNSGASVTYGGTTLSIGGSFTWNGGTFAFSGTGITIGGSYTTNGTFDTAGKTLTFVGNVNSSTITAGNSLLNSTVMISKSTSGSCLTINTTVAAGTTINLGTSPTSVISDGAYCTQSNQLINNGTILVGGTWTITSTDSKGGGLVNNGTITHSGNGWTLGPKGSFTNNTGATTTYAGTGLTVASNFTQRGYFDMTGKILTINGADSTITANGELGGKVVIGMTDGWSAGSLFTVTAGTSINLRDNPTISMARGGGGYQSYSLTNNGIITVDSGTLTISGNGTGTFTNNGIVINNGSGFVMSNFSLVNSANASINYIGSSMSVGGSFANAGNNNFGASTALTVSTSLTNTGTTTGVSAVTVGTDFTQSGSFDLTGKTVTFNTSANGILTTSSFGGSLIINKGAANTLTLANNITVQNVTITAGVLANPATSKTMTVTGDLSAANGANLGGANLSILLSGSNNQNISVTSGTVPSPLQINKSGGNVILQNNYTGAGSTAPLTVTTGTLYLNGKNLIATTTISSSGILQLQGVETISTPTLSSGSTVTYVGDGDGLADSYDLKPFNYYNLIASSTDSNDTFTGGNISNVFGNFTVNHGVVTFPANINIGGNLTKTGGSINATSTSFVLNGADQTISLNATTTIGSLTKIATTSSQTLTFGTTGNLIITGTTTLQGTTTYPLLLRSASTDTQWYFQPDGPRVLSYVDVQDSNNTSLSGINISQIPDFINSGNLTGWTVSLPSISVASQGSQISTTTMPVSGLDLGGAFTLNISSGNADITSIKIRQNGSLPISAISNIQLYYNIATTCSAVKPSGASLFGATSTFEQNGYASIAGTITLSEGSQTCLYPTYDLTGNYSTSTLGRSIDFEISNPVTDITASAGTVSTSGRVIVPRRTIVTTPDIVSLLSLKMNEANQDPTVFYLQNNAVWKKVGNTVPIRLTDPNLQVQALSFIDLTGLNSAGVIKITMTVSNVDPGADPSALNVTRTYSTTATIKAYSGSN